MTKDSKKILVKDLCLFSCAAHATRVAEHDEATEELMATSLSPSPGTAVTQRTHRKPAKAEQRGGGNGGTLQPS